MKKELIKPINDSLNYDKDDLVVCVEICVAEMTSCGGKDSGGSCPRICKPWVR